MKIGIDLHGVSDAYPTFFSELCKLFIAAGGEVHLMTGELVTEKLHEQIERCGITYTHLFSISEYHKEKGTPMRFDEKGTPWIDEELWCRSKGDYAREHKLDIVFDDTEEYAKYFTTPFVFCRGYNKEKGKTRIEGGEERIASN